jgi:hypothetical protein
MDADQLAERFRHHPPTVPAVIAAHEVVRELAAAFARALNEALPECDEKAKALDAVDLAAMHANSAVARTQLYGHPEWALPKLSGSVDTLVIQFTNFG